jgi:two-component system cell cycle response regulator DivK
MKLNILYIEDHPDNMTLVRRVIHASEYDLIEARTGLQGLMIAESQKVNLILLDINLPDIDGYEVLRRIRSSSVPGLAQVPVIAVTANALKGDARRILAAGCDGYISKPFEIETLMGRIADFLPEQSV